MNVGRATFVAAVLGLMASVVSLRAQTPGSSDPDFHNTDYGPGDYARFAVLSDGRFIVSYSYNTIHNETFGSLYRYNADGSRDTSFQTPFGGAFLYRLIAQGDDKILLGGDFGVDPKDTVLDRLNPDGSLDGGFQRSLNSYHGPVQAIAVQTDGKILAGGAVADADGAPLFCLARLNADGTVDTTFQSAVSGSVTCLALQGDGRIVVGGTLTYGTSTLSVAVARLNPDGSVDPTFTPPEQNVPSYTTTAVTALAVQGDGKIVRLGETDSQYAGTRVLLFDRLNPDGSVDAGFQPYPSYVIPVDRNVPLASRDIFYALLLQSDGSIIVGGNFQASAGSKRVDVARFNPGGELDTRFVAAPNSEKDFVYNAAFGPGGKLVVGGVFNGFDGVEDHGLARLFARTAPAAAVELRIGGEAVAGQSNGKAIVTRSGGDMSAPLTVRYKVKGTAVAGVDYRTLSGAVVFPAGVSKAKIKVKPIADSPSTGTRKVTLILLPAADGGYEAGNGKTKVKIVGQ